MKHRWKMVGVYALFSLLPMAASARDYVFVDAHLHYVDFFQRSDGIYQLAAAMQKANVEHALIMGLGVMKKWAEDSPKKPQYFLSDDAPVYWYSATDFRLAETLTRAPKELQMRFSPFISGINPTDRNAADHVKELLELYPGFWKGIGEVFTRHDDLTQLLEGEVPRADHAAMMTVYQLAAQYRLPVMVHSDITAKREDHPLYLSEFERAVKENPATLFIWAHAGTSEELNRRLGHLDFLVDEVGRMLETYPNLYIDLSWSVLRPYLLDEQDQPRKEWVQLVERFPGRFMLGSDVVGSFDSIKKNLNAFTPFLDALQEKTAYKLTRENFLKLVGGENAKVNVAQN